MLLEKEKLLITRNFSFSHSVFKRLVQQNHKNQGLFGRGSSRLISLFYPILFVIPKCTQFQCISIIPDNKLGMT